MDLGRIEFGALLDAIAARTPAPGGGAVASAVGALAAALAGMVVSYSVGRKSAAASEPALADAAARLASARRLLLGLAAEDMEAYGLVSELTRLPEGDARRESEMRGAVEAAMQAPRATIAACVDLLRLFEALAPIASRSLRSDLAIAAVLAEATARASKWNVLANLPMLKGGHGGEEPAQRSGGRGDPSEAIVADVERMLDDAAGRLRRVESACR